MKNKKPCNSKVVIEQGTVSYSERLNDLTVAFKVYQQNRKLNERYFIADKSYSRQIVSYHVISAKKIVIN